ncbi:DUF2244 domain-containing protein [Paracoccus sp. p3-h83]|uniref:DUF2244 domain-containing protein n=1 Tax=Paracoccus sp. p3-h83 TaxID=3342805 RepID=UPI0035B6F362
MPYRWMTTPDAEVMQATAHQSLTPGLFTGFIATTAGLLGLALLALIGSPALWVLLVFALGALAGVWWALDLHRRRSACREVLRIEAGTLTLTRHDPGQPPRLWQAPLDRAQVQMDAGHAPVPFYLTLHGGPRVVELAAFLTPAERRSLYGDLRQRLRRV